MWASDTRRLTGFGLALLVCAPLLAAPLGAPNLDALPHPLPQRPLDLEALAKGYGNASGSAGQGQTSGPSLLVFISLSMPQPTLQRLMNQAARARATVYLRGLTQGSLRETVIQVQRLIGQQKVAVHIDPQAFDRFGIERVPSFVLVHHGMGEGAQSTACASSTCAPAQDYLRTTGDVSLDYALDHMQRQAPQFNRDIARFLQPLKGH